MRSTDGNTDVVDCCVSTMVLPLFYSSGAVVYRKPVLSVAHHLHNLFYTLGAVGANRAGYLTNQASDIQHRISPPLLPAVLGRAEALRQEADLMDTPSMIVAS